ncbi:MAG: methyltransferase domain-containing protein [Methanoregulaceae archaeon]|nr:methyltransferase domain-containing protein [Methanoregulaceae archaeon]
MSPAPAPAYGDIDWNEVWKARQLRHESSKHFDDPSHNWDRRENAIRYDTSSRSEYDVRVKTTIAGLPLKKSQRVLDIGAGPGTRAIPLAPLVKEVTAIEPGEGMVAILNDHIRKNGINNITCIQKRWEDVDPAHDLAGPYDLVIASLSLTMEEIRESLAKMDAASSGYVYLFWFADPPFWERMYLDLWPELHGETYHPGPKADCLFNVLYQMGIYPNVEMLPLDKEYRFSTHREMLAFFRRRFAVKTQKQRRMLDKYIAPLIRQEGGEAVISGDSTFAKIWWEKPA